MDLHGCESGLYNSLMSDDLPIIEGELLEESSSVPGSESSLDLDSGRYRRFSNGAVYDTERGRIVANPGGGVYAFKQGDSRAVAANKKRWSDYHVAALDGLQRATRKESSVLAWGYIVERQASLALDTDKGRASTVAAEFVGKAAGILGVPDDGAGESPGAGVSVSIDNLLLVIGELTGGGASTSTGGGVPAAVPGVPVPGGVPGASVPGPSVPGESASASTSGGAAGVPGVRRGRSRRVAGGR